MSASLERLSLVILAIAVVLAPWLIANQFVLLLLQLVGIGSIVVVGLNLVLGYAGQISLGHGALFGLGAYGAAVVALRFDQGWPVGAVVAIGVAVIGGLLLGVPALRLEGAYLAMATMAFNIVIQRLMVNVVGITGGPDGLPGIPPASIGPLIFDRRTMLYLVAACAAVVFWLTRNLVGSYHGRALMAVREDELAASASGVPVYRTKLGVFALSAAYAGLAGSLFAHVYRHISPISFGLEASIEFLMAVLLGGPGHPWWPLAGVLIVTVLPQLPALQALQDYRLLVYGGLLLGSVVLFRGGLARLTAHRGDYHSTPAPTETGPGKTVTPGTAPILGAPVASLSRGSQDAPTPGTPALELRSVTKRFGGVAALTSVRLTLQHGLIHGMIGPNGSGKTTAINLASGIFAPDDGQVVVRGVDVTGWAPHRLAALGVARTFQTARLFDGLSVLDNLLIGYHPRRRSSTIASLLHLPAERGEEQASRESAEALAFLLGLQQHLYRPARDLPPGIRRRVELARALASQPTLLMLDEPAAGLDEREIEELVELVQMIKATGVTVLVVEHNVEIVLTLCDQLTVLDHGQVLAHGQPRAVLEDPRVLEAYLGRRRPAAPRA